MDAGRQLRVAPAAPVRMDRSGRCGHQLIAELGPAAAKCNPENNPPREP